MHSYGGIVLHDVINDRFARKAIEKGADGLIAVAAGAGGHAGTLSPFALVAGDPRLVRRARSRCPAPSPTAARCWRRRRWAPTSPISASRFIATEEARRRRRPTSRRSSKRRADDIVYTNLFTGVHGNYLRQIDAAAGLDPDNLPQSRSVEDEFRLGDAQGAWKDIWGSGQGIGVLDRVVPAAALVDRLEAEYPAARAALL